MCDAVLGLPSPETVIVMLTFCRVESKVTVAFPKPDVGQGVGVSCDPVSTAPSVCAERLPTKSKAIAMLTNSARCFISPPLSGEILPLLQVVNCKFHVTLRIRDVRHVSRLPKCHIARRLGRGAAAARIAI